MADEEEITKYTVVFEQEPSGWYHVSIEELPGFATAGRDLEEAWEKLGEAAYLFITQNG